jgi:hypothetical protein
LTTRKSQASAIAAALQPYLPLPLGSLRIWGDAFGRPGDNQHVAIGAMAHGRTLVLDFAEGETLLVLEPGECQIERNGGPDRPHLRIASARRVEWGWFVYGLPRRHENWFVETHWVEDGAVRATTTADWYDPRFTPSIDEPAVTFI